MFRKINEVLFINERMCATPFSTSGVAFLRMTVELPIFHVKIDEYELSIFQCLPKLHKSPYKSHIIYIVKFKLLLYYHSFYAYYICSNSCQRLYYKVQ